MGWKHFYPLVIHKSGIKAISGLRCWTCFATSLGCENGIISTAKPQMEKFIKNIGASQFSGKIKKHSSVTYLSLLHLWWHIFFHAKYTWWPNQHLIPFKQLPQRCEYVCRLNVSAIEATTRANLLNRSDVTLSRICFSTYLASMKHPRTLFTTRFRLSSSLLHPPGSKNESRGENTDVMLLINNITGNHLFVVDI